MNVVISIIGFGNVGKLLCALLLARKDHQFSLNIIDINPKIEGALLDLEHANQLNQSHTISTNSQHHLNNSDFIFHCAGASVPQGKSRLDICQESVDITEQIFKDFKPTKLPFIIVVANPVEIISTVTYKITGLPSTQILGTGTFLDSLRMNHLVSKANKDFINIDSVLLGEHGKTVFLSEQLSSINGRQFSEYFDRKQIDEFMTSVINSAQKIKATQEATMYGVCYCAISLFESLLNESESQKPVSILIPEDLKNVMKTKDIFLSLPAKISKNGVIASTDYQANNFELDALNQSLKNLIHCIPKKYL